MFAIFLFSFCFEIGRHDTNVSLKNLLQFQRLEVQATGLRVWQERQHQEAGGLADRSPQVEQEGPGEPG